MTLKDQVEDIRRHAERVLWAAKYRGLVAPAPTWDDINTLLVRIQELEGSLPQALKCASP